MKPEEQNLAIAEACGWKMTPPGWWSHPTLPCNGGAEPEPPDYFNDLNAMADAEATLTDFERIAHATQLQEITNNHVVGFVSDYRRDLQALSRICGATAADRAEAFLRAKGIHQT